MKYARWIVLYVAGMIPLTGIALAASAGDHRADAVVKCGYDITEDTATHIRLVDYTRTADGQVVLVYRCR